MPICQENRLVITWVSNYRCLFVIGHPRDLAITCTLLASFAMFPAVFKTYETPYTHNNNNNNNNDNDDDNDNINSEVIGYCCVVPSRDVSRVSITPVSNLFSPSNHILEQSTSHTCLYIEKKGGLQRLPRNRTPANLTSFLRAKYR